MNLTLHLDTAGVVIADLALRLYDGITAMSLAGLVLTPLAGGKDYKLAGLPDAGACYTLTAEFPVGTYRAWRWGGGVDVPARLILPIRTAGATLASLDVAAFANHAPFAGALALQELGAPGDYALSGWPIPGDAEPWSVRWKAGGRLEVYTWSGRQGAPWWANLTAAASNRIASALALAQVIKPGLVLLKGRRNVQHANLSAGTDYLRAYVRKSTARRLSGGDHSLGRITGFIVLEWLLQMETGDDDVEAMVDAVNHAFFTGSDGLEFEDEPFVFDGREAGSHWLVSSEYPFHVQTVRKIA